MSINYVQRHDWTRPLASVETVEVPVRRMRRVFYLTGSVVFGGLVAYLVSSGDGPLIGEARFAFHIGLAALAVYVTGAVRLYYGIVSGRSRLSVGPAGVALGEHLIGWADIQHISLRPASPVLRYLAFGPPSVRIQARQRLRRIDVTRDHVKDLEGFAEWLERIRTERTAG
ncbi:hypothetical protein [Kribbella sp. NPDC051620]|uniref:hypothetical protein n=1 Tax=Kribbella sp. NPDC051620 TaxID=3364120 RepID=UPI00379914A7